MRSVKAALVQMRVTEDKERNLRSAADAVRRAADAGAQVVCLPEMFACQYENHSFIENQEEAGGKIWQTLSAIARENHVILIGGSFPESDGGRLYNSCFIFDENGQQIGRHRKVHLFDVDVAGGISFKESDTFTAGSDFTVLETSLGRIGVEICFDIRFVEQTRLMALDGAQLIFVPAAFNMTTGPAHWDLTFRARALDNPVYMCGCSPARDENGPYVAYGGSIITSPWGEIVDKLDEKPGILLQTVDMSRVEAVRSQLPILSARRKDLYRLEEI